MIVSGRYYIAPARSRSPLGFGIFDRSKKHPETGQHFRLCQDMPRVAALREATRLNKTEATA